MQATSKGQITIPLKIRQQLGLKVSDKLEFISQAGQIIVQPARDQEDPFQKYIGVLGTFAGGVEEINAWVQEMRQDEEPPARALTLDTSRYTQDFTELKLLP